MCLTAIYLFIAWLSSGIWVDYNILTATVILDLAFWIGMIYLAAKGIRFYFKKKVKG